MNVLSEADLPAIDGLTDFLLDRHS